MSSEDVESHIENLKSLKKKLKELQIQIKTIRSYIEQEELNLLYYYEEFDNFKEKIKQHKDVFNKNRIEKKILKIIS